MNKPMIKSLSYHSQSNVYWATKSHACYSEQRNLSAQDSKPGTSSRRTRFMCRDKHSAFEILAMTDVDLDAAKNT